MSSSKLVDRAIELHFSVGWNASGDALKEVLTVKDRLRKAAHQLLLKGQFRQDPKSRTVTITGSTGIAIVRFLDDPLGNLFLDKPRITLRRQSKR